jgi:rhodanese-related sulfurtransferase
MVQMSVIQLENEALSKMLAENKDLQLLDVRTPPEYFQLGHIPGSKLVPIYELPDHLENLDPKAVTVVVCEHGIRSADASHWLMHNGFEKVYNLSAGMAEWNGPREYASH